MDGNKAVIRFLGEPQELMALSALALLGAPNLPCGDLFWDQFAESVAQRPLVVTAPGPEFAFH